jgi:threonine/homoserine/homoserine lactone efflux protein
VRALWTGILAGYGIAIPVGAIAVLIVQTGIRSGFRRAAAAGAGAAAADLIYAVVAVSAGAAVAASVESLDDPFRWAGAVVLFLIGAIGLWRGWGETPDLEPAPEGRTGYLSTFLRFLGLTLINPLTVVAFTAFVLGMGLAEGLAPVEGVLFVAGVAGASLSWQTVLAGIGAFARHRLSERFRHGAVVLGNLIVIALAILVLVR